MSSTRGQKVVGSSLSHIKVDGYVVKAMSGSIISPNSCELRSNGMQYADSKSLQY
jgi:hypothetical protein